MDPAPSAVTSHLAALLPSLTADAAQGARLVHDRRLDWLWQALAGAPGLALEPVPGPGAGRCYDLLLESDAGRAALALSATDDTMLAMAAAAGLGGRLRSLVVDALFDETLGRLAALALPGTRVVSLAPAAAPERAHDGWCALRGAGGEICRLAPQAIAPGIVDALLAARRAAPAAAAWRTRMQLPASVVVAERRLSIGLLRTLAPGDVLLLPGAPATLEGAPAALCVRAGAGTCLGGPGRLGDAALTLLEGLAPMEQDTLPDAATASAAESLAELELPLRFEIETVSIPLADLEAIGPGYVIEFATPVSQARLRLVSCGLVIGEADLIAVGNRLGARITRLIPRDE